jgi:hypothetical protein
MDVNRPFNCGRRSTSFLPMSKGRSAQMRALAGRSRRVCVARRAWRRRTEPGTPSHKQLSAVLPTLMAGRCPERGKATARWSIHKDGDIDMGLLIGRPFSGRLPGGWGDQACILAAGNPRNRTAWVCFQPGDRKVFVPPARPPSIFEWRRAKHGGGFCALVPRETEKNIYDPDGSRHYHRTCSGRRLSCVGSARSWRPGPFRLGPQPS